MRFLQTLLLGLLVFMLPLTVFAQEPTSEPTEEPAQDDAARDAAVSDVELSQEVTYFDGRLTLSLPETWASYHASNENADFIMIAANNESIYYLGYLIGVIFDSIVAELDPQATVEPTLPEEQPEIFVVGMLIVQPRDAMEYEGEVTFEQLAADLEANLGGSVTMRRELEVDGYPGLLLMSSDDSGDFVVPEGGEAHGVTAFIDYGDEILVFVGVSASTVDESVTFEAILRSLHYEPADAAEATTEP